MISTPLCLYDCDAPCDGSTAVVVSHADYAPDTPNTGVPRQRHRHRAAGPPQLGPVRRHDHVLGPGRGGEHVGAHRAAPADVDVAELYDGFSILTMVWLEELGLCGKGESGPFVDGGQRIALDGPVPLNTSGGQLSAGRLHGFGMLHEACVQLRGEGGDAPGPGAPRRWPPSPPAAGPSPAACSSPAARRSPGP